LSLSALLHGRALDVYSMMSKDDVNDYDKLKAALLKRYQLTADGFRKRFRTSYPEQGESPVQFITRLENYLVRWVELAGDNKTYDGIKKLFVEEQYLRSCPKEMSMHLREGKPATLKDLGERAETYLEAHSADIVFGIDPKFSNMRGSFEPKTCHKCGSSGHFKSQCPRSSPKSSPKRPSAPQHPTIRPGPPVPAPRSIYGEFRPSTFQRGPLRCYNCNHLGHVAKDCRVRPTPTAAMEFQEHPDLRPQQRYYQLQEYPRYPEYSQYPETERADNYPRQEKVVPVDMQSLRPRYGNRPPVSTPKSPTTSGIRPPTCRQHNVLDCEECFNKTYNPLPQTHHCQALVAICQDCGQQQPVIADACQSSCKHANMPVSDGLLEDQPVKVLKDSGCTTVVVRRSLVPEDKLTGQEECCVLIDGTVRRTPVAKIFIEMPYYTGLTTAVRTNNPLFDVIVGNVPGSTGLPFTSPCNRKRRYTGRPWFRNFCKKKDQDLREFC